MSKSSWTPDADQDLLFSIMMGDAVSRPSPNWEQVTAVMQELGYTFTKQAIRLSLTSPQPAFCQETLGRLRGTPQRRKGALHPVPREEDRENSYFFAEEEEVAAPRATPSKRPKPVIDEEDEDELFEVVTPTKKPKVEKETKMEVEDALEH
ncbi:hypothetical protein SAPIO_CDS3936 [Scedosporium apiospermum]|uniref:Uncharacterized protein n=1 Tax=Pseudallescheria apiosperma TaxID=563466 RepID=A0A084G8X7_PSEDA|nr:uncharacterized protein SAPIO_CDS3936 [Scedosporium apiospermum]KEZ43789.1 hypothetical protein SAPIO_CDS3936 [Scedosporium apiospermum]